MDVFRGLMWVEALGRVWLVARVQPLLFRQSGAGGSGVGIFVMRTCVPLWAGFGGLALCGTGGRMR